MAPINNFSRGQIAKYISEFLGTGFLVLTIKVSVSDLNYVKSDLGSFAIGFVLMVIIYQYGYVSGAHFNPAVSIGIVSSGGTKSFPFSNYGQIALYLFAQFFGGFFGGLYSWTIGGRESCLVYTQLNEEFFWPIQGFFCEFTFTFLLVFSVLHTGISQAGNSFYGLTIGLTLFVSVLAINTATGCAINPAVYVGTTLPAICCKSWYGQEVDDIQVKYWWMYIVSEFLAAVLAGVFFRFVYGLEEFGNKLERYNDDNGYNSELKQQLLQNDDNNEPNVMMTSVQNL